MKSVNVSDIALGQRLGGQRGDRNWRSLQGLRCPARGDHDVGEAACLRLIGQTSFRLGDRPWSPHYEYRRQTCTHTTRFALISDVFNDAYSPIASCIEYTPPFSCMTAVVVWRILNRSVPPHPYTPIQRL